MIGDRRAARARAWPRFVLITLVPLLGAPTPSLAAKAKRARKPAPQAEAAPAPQTASSPSTPRSSSAASTRSLMPIDEGERRWIATGSFGVLAPMQGIRPVRALRLRADFVRPEWRLNPRTRLGVGGSLGFSYGSRTEHPTLYFGFVTDPDTVEMQRAITVDAMPMGRLFFEVNERIELFAQSGAGLQWGHYSLERTTDLIDYRIESRASANHTALALRFGGGASFKASASWRLAVELVGLDFLVGSTGVGSLYSLLVGAQYAL